ncbi:hypothetical protein RI129_005759 [Pyrocoelia pectoralis]|uniref:Putative treble-clef zinc-finger domain-containing protein n=1 Tax=Pyrocoelia pectoralis TaxID=417401 RepID=A0AAN7VHY7_9COLE
MPKKELRIKRNALQPSIQSKDLSQILLNLGKATRRGIKKCYKCGVYNGTRGLMCKNKQCAAVFRECEEKETNLNATKLFSGTSRQVFSVKVRGKGPDYRGFVQLPVVEGNTVTEEADVALSEVALCFVDSCQRLFDDSILKCHEIEGTKVISICIHIKSALKSVNVAIPIETKNCLLHTLNFNDDVKRQLWSLSTEARGALVQRVSKTVMAVKCQVSPKHPLGYLHFTFCTSKGNRVIYDKFFCNCLSLKGYGINNSDSAINQKCIHFYACIWAFASDLKFTEEFINFLNVELCVDKSEEVIEPPSVEPPCNSRKHLKTRSANLTETVFNPAQIAKSKSCLDKHYFITKLDVSMQFIDWLSSLTERVNQCITNNKKEGLQALQSYIPLSFFVLLQARIHQDEKLHNFYTCTNSTGITYVVRNTSYLKKVFDTPQVSLQLVQVQEEIITHSHVSRIFIEDKIWYLKVGLSEKDGNFTPFTIVWSPSVLPISNFGKMDLIFYVGCR